VRVFWHRAVFAFVCTAFLVTSISPVLASAPRPLDYRAYDTWSDARDTTLSPDGSALAYVVTPEDADPTLVVRTLATGKQRTQVRGSAPVFVDDGRFVVFTYLAPRKEIDAAKNADKPAS
jgi:hypothetical protein